MNIDFDRLKHLSFEIEGLLLLNESKTDQVVRDSIAGMIRLKIEEMYNMTSEFTPCCVIEDESETLDESSVHDEVKLQNESECNCSCGESEDERSHGNLADDFEYDDESEDERSHGNLEDDFEGMSYELNETEKDADILPDEVEMLSEEDEIEENEVNLTDEIFDEDVDEISDDEISEDYVFSDDEIAEYKEESGDEDEKLTVEEKLARQGVKDLRRAFTVNDRYRFRRELFGNSDIEFSDTINLVSAMSSIAEMEEYFYDDLEWDKENQEVKDFINILSLYFKN